MITFRNLYLYLQTSSICVNISLHSPVFYFFHFPGFAGGGAYGFCLPIIGFTGPKFLGIANEMTGWINSQYNNVEDYFNLKEENRRVHKINDSLLNLLACKFYANGYDSTRLITDSIPYDTLGHYRRYYLPGCQVVYNTVNAEKNYIQINRGSNQGIKDNMAVISSDGVR